ncbi:MAG: MarR family winged helix-turn-helix transcriptional regulator, partial [Afipia sp.]
LSDGSGLSVKTVAALLHVDSSFVSVQSKMLEKRDLIRRSRCMEDRRIMLLSLTDKATRRLTPLIPTRARLQGSIRGDLDGSALLQLSNMLSALRDRMRKETALVATGE